MSNKSPSPLLGEFPVPSLSEWQHEVERLLKGAPFAKKMFTRTWEGITVNPIYTEADTADIPWLDTAPGEAPFVRGNRSGGYHEVAWLVAQELSHADVATFNRRLRDALAAGQTAVNLMTSDGAAAGERGTAVGDIEQMTAALNGVDLASLPIQLRAGHAALPAFAVLVATLRKQGVDLARLEGCVGCSPLATAIGEGRGVIATARIHDEMMRLTSWARREAPRLRTLPIAEQPWHEGGADLALSLGLTLAEAVEVLRACEERGLEPDAVVPRFQFDLEIGTDFFMEMAKLRALRLLWSRLLVATGVAPAETKTFIHARTARRSQTALDPEVNLLRATTQAMSAVLGGTDSLCVRPFDEISGQPDGFSERIARNTQLILAHECHLDQVADPAGGAWYIESLTRDLAEKAWGRLQAVEVQGGLAAALASGWVQEQIATAAAARAASYAKRRHVLVGTNMYPVASGEAPPAERKTESHAAQAAANEEAKRSALAGVAGCSGDELVAALIAAASQGASVAELSDVLRADADDQVPFATVPLRRDGAPFEALRAMTARVAAADPASARVYTACLGDFARYMPRLEFARGFCEVGGFEVVGDGLLEVTAAPDELVGAFRASGARIVMLVGLDDTYAAQAATVAAALRATEDPPLVVLAGAPGEHEESWRAAGIGSFIHLGCDALQTLTSWLPAAEVQS